jgi:hypothetical protein
MSNENTSEPDVPCLNSRNATNTEIATLAGSGTIVNDNIPLDTTLMTKPQTGAANTSATFTFPSVNNVAPSN